MVHTPLFPYISHLAVSLTLHLDIPFTLQPSLSPHHILPARAIPQTIPGYP